MPLLFIFLLGLLLGEGFGQNPDRNLRISVVNLDQGYNLDRAAGWLGLTPAPVPLPGAVPPPLLAALGLDLAQSERFPPQGKWANVVLNDLKETAGIRVEIIEDLQTAQYLCRESKRPAVLVLGPYFSHRVAQCSFLRDGINPFYRDGIQLEELDASLIRDDTQEDRSLGHRTGRPGDVAPGGAALDDRQGFRQTQPAGVHPAPGRPGPFAGAPGNDSVVRTQGYSGRGRQGDAQRDPARGLSRPAHRGKLSHQGRPGRAGA